MDLKTIRDRQALAEYFHQNISLHAYSLGDLDDFYWPNVTCIGLESASGFDEVSVLYQGNGLPVLLAFSQEGKMNGKYFSQIFSLLPDQFYAHLSPKLEIHFSDIYQVKAHGNHFKMELQLPDFASMGKIENICQLSEDDLPEMIDLYECSYPGNSFNPRMVLTEQYFGYREAENLVCVGGVHVYSREYKVAVLGNITTHPEFRKRGLGRRITSTICSSLLEKVSFIGLNVKCDNLPAINLYQSLGFAISSQYGEFSCKKASKS